MPIPEDMLERVQGQQDRRPDPGTTGSAGAGGCSPAPFLREFTGDRPLGAPRHRRPVVQRPAAPTATRPPAAPASRSPRWSTTCAGSALRARGPGEGLRDPALLAPVVLAHPLRDADHRGVVRRDLVLVAELVGPPHRRHPATGPLAVVGDQQQGHVADRCARLDEALDPAAAAHELVQVLLVRASAARTVVEPVRAVAPRARNAVPHGDGTVEQAHGTSVPVAPRPQGGATAARSVQRWPPGGYPTDSPG